MPELPQQMVTTADELAELCAHLRTCSVIGLDTEFIGESSYHPLLCLVQVASEERLALIDPLGGLDLTPFWQLVADGERTVVVHAGREEARMCRQGIGQPPGKPFDLQVAAGLLGYGFPVGHAALVHTLLRAHLSKGETLTDWARRPLTPQQVKYAYDDVRYLLTLHKKLAGKLEKLGRTAWADEEFAIHTKKALLDNPESERWRKLRGAGALDSRKLAILRELYKWREAFGERVNRPARTLLRDDLLVDMARRAPTNERDLQTLRGMPKHDPGPILDAVARGKAVPADELPAEAERDFDAPPIHLVCGLLSAALGDFCAREFLTQSLVATTADLKQLVRCASKGEPLPAEAPLARGWRKEAVLPVLEAVLSGRVGLRVADMNASSPFERFPTEGGSG